MRQKVKTYAKKILVLLIVSLGFLVFQGCNNMAMLAPIKALLKLNEQARAAHAEELLNKKYKKSVVAEFANDEKFAMYIEKYLATKAKKINSVDFTNAIVKISDEKQYDPVFLMAIMKTESSFNPNAVGSVGEIGLMQIKPTTAEWICQKNGIEWKGAEALKDPEYNMLVGAAYFKYLMEADVVENSKTKGRDYIIAYNTGINKLTRLPDSERPKHDYYKKVMKNYLKIYSELKSISTTLQVASHFD